jgi:DNA-binding CsgD family transcriptional regulator
MTDQLFERDRELASLTRLVADATEGRGRCALIEGPAGIGKSRLLAEARAQAGEMRVLGARGGELERDFPFGVVRQLFESLVADPAERERLLSGSAAPAASVFGALDPSDAVGAGDASFATLHGLFWLALNLAEQRPLLLAIDDLHWCDRASLRFVTYLVRRLEDVPILVAATLRTAEPGTDTQLIGEIAHDPSTVAVQPGSLSSPAVAELVGERLETDAAAREFTAACHRATGGNPLLLRQLLTALESDGVEPTAANAPVIAEIGPRAVSRTVLPRLARQPDTAIATARAAAVLGEGAPLPVAAQLAGLDERAVADATADLARAEILLPELPLRFVHPLVREAVYRDLPAGERGLQHGRAAAILHEAGAADDEVAAQLLLAPPRGEAWIAQLLHEAGRAAMRRGAPESAAAYMRRALAEPADAAVRPWLLFELGSAEALTSGPAAIDHLRAAYRELDDPVARSIAAGLLGRALMFMGDPEGGATVARRAIADLPPGDESDDLRLALESFELMTVFFGAGDAAELDRLLPYREAPAGDAAGARMMAAMAAWHWLGDGGTADETVALALAALEGGVLLAADGGLLSLAATATLVVADREEALEAFEQSIADAYRSGSLYVIASTHLWRGFTLYRRGDLQEAEEQLRAALHEFTLWGFAESATAHAEAFLSNVLRERGDLEGARAALERIGDTVTLGANFTGWWYGARLTLALAEGRNEDALELADLLAGHCEYLTDPARLWWRGYKAEALDRLGRTDEALDLARAELEVVRRWGGPGPLGRTLRVLGTLEREAGIDRLLESVAVLEQSPARLELAKSLAALGGALRRARKPTDAREPLRRALDLAGACDAAPLADHVRAELHATGARPRTDALAGIEALTPSERRVVDLAASGDTNREIAQALYVTPKTVEVHLSNSYRKLGIRSRRELPAALGEAA